jgi:hypothetical protein
MMINNEEYEEYEENEENEEYEEYEEGCIVQMEIMCILQEN